MARKIAKKAAPKRRRTTRRAKPVRRRPRRVGTRADRAAEAAVDVLGGPLQPELPIDPDATVEALDPDTIEAVIDTQELADDRDIAQERSIDDVRSIVLSGGDVDAARDDGSVGEETVGGSTPTPDQDVVDDLGRAAGITYSDTEPLRPEEKERARDDKRWELDPASAEDYPDRVRRSRPRAGRPRARRAR